MENLPEELVTQILLLTAKPWKQAEARSSLSRVSSRWKYSVDDCPLFWTEILLHMNLRLIGVILSHNPIGPLDIALNNSRKRIRPEEVLRRVELVSGLSSRWRRIYFDGEMTPEVAAHLSRPTPNLRSILISPLRKSEREVTRYTLDAGGRQLREVHIINNPACFDWTTPRLSGLRVLRLNPAGSPDLLPTNVLRSILRSTQQLRIRAINMRSRNDQHFEVDLDTGIIPLLSLVSLALIGLPKLFLQDLLASVQVPICQSVVIGDTDIRAIDSNESLSSMKPPLQVPFNHIERLSICYWEKASMINF